MGTRRYALLFPGQASQRVGMDVPYRSSSQAAAELLDRLDALTGRPVTRVMAEGPLELLTDTRYAQPAVVAASLAALLLLRERLGGDGLLAPTFCAGHSVGELAALVASGALDAEAALELVAHRAASMAEACDRVDGTMAAVIGVDTASLEQLCALASGATGERLEIANLNAPDQLVVSGHANAVDWLLDNGRAHGARRVIKLTVGGPFHSSYMRPAAEHFATVVAAAPLREPEFPVVLNQTARPASSVEEIRQELGQQVAAPVRWSESLAYMGEAGCRLFVEVGPGQVLSGLVRRTLPDAIALTTADAGDIEAAVAALGQ